MESIDLLKFKYQHGVYNLKYLVELVQQESITEEDFFNITRLKYDPVKKEMGVTL